MSKSTVRPQIMLITFLITSGFTISNQAQAEVFKWRDSKGIIQYSDKAPITSNKTNTILTATPSSKKIAQPLSSSTTSLRNGGNLSTLQFSRTKPIKAPKPVLVTPIPTEPAPIEIVVPAPSEPVITAPTPTPIPTEPVTTPELIQTELHPAVDISKNILPSVGFSTFRIQPTTEIAPPSGGEFRVVCTPSHMSNDDPIVFPNQQGVAHHHTFYGNVGLNYKSDLMGLSSLGNSTCNGGIMNRSAYWHPSMIDTSSNTPIPPSFAIFYYKSGGVDGSIIQAPPKGLRMITGNGKATDANSAKSMFTCLAPEGVTRPFYGWSKNIPACAVGDSMQMLIGFPQCWDGKNLDSPNHQDHMAGPINGQCPTTHPVAIPNVTLGLSFKITADQQTSKWRLSSDNYLFDGKNAGYSAHADWVNGWDESTMNGIVKNCLNAKVDGHAHLLCDGRMFY